MGAFVLSVVAMPVDLWTLMPVGLILGVVLTVLTFFRLDLIMRSVTLVAQGLLFTMALSSSISGPIVPENVPILLLAFVTILCSDQTLTLISSYSFQFSKERQGPLFEFNSPTLARSLDQLYGRVASNCAVYATSYLVALAMLSIAPALRSVPILPDVSIYVIVTSIALAFLVILKED
jgi:uncharacterized membrane protein